MKLHRAYEIPLQEKGLGVEREGSTRQAAVIQIATGKKHR